MIRGMRFEPDDEPQGPPPRRIDADLDRVLAGLGSPPVEVLTTIVERWPELIGPDAAAVSEPVSVSDGCLVVVVAEPAWVSQLRWSETNSSRLCRMQLLGTLQRMKKCSPREGCGEQTTRALPRTQIDVAPNLLAMGKESFFISLFAFVPILA